MPNFPGKALRRLQTFDDLGGAVTGPRRTSPCRDDSIPVIAGLAERIAARRIDLQLTQQSLAELAGVSRSSVQAVEYGAGSVKLELVAAIADVLGLDLELSPR
ncbi:helix-turn-helix domain-containing protein [Mycolicibacillus trivialis]